MSSPTTTDIPRTSPTPLSPTASDGSNSHSRPTTGDSAQNQSSNPGSAPVKRKASRRANTAERRATHNAVERQRRETLNGRFLDLALLLPNLATVRRPSKSAIVNSSIALIHSQRRMRAAAGRELRALESETSSLRREVNEWRARAGGGIPPLLAPQRSPEFGALVGVDVEEVDLATSEEEERRAWVLAGEGGGEEGDDDDMVGPQSAHPGHDMSPTAGMAVPRGMPAFPSIGVDAERERERERERVQWGALQFAMAQQQAQQQVQAQAQREWAAAAQVAQAQAQAQQQAMFAAGVGGGEDFSGFPRSFPGVVPPSFYAFPPSAALSSPTLTRSTADHPTLTARSAPEHSPLQPHPPTPADMDDTSSTSTGGGSPASERVHALSSLPHSLQSAHAPPPHPSYVTGTSTSSGRRPPLGHAHSTGHVPGPGQWGVGSAGMGMGNGMVFPAGLLI